MKISDFYLFNELSEAELEKLESISRKEKFYKDNILFYRGSDSTKLHLLLSGIARIYKHDERGNEITIHTITAPSFIAEIANFNNIPYPANCSLETDSDVVLIDYRKFEKEFLYQPKIMMQFIKSLSNKIRVLESFISNNINKNSISKVAKFLYDHEKDLDKLKNIQIAKILGITPETLSRKITLLKKEGVITKVDANIKITDKEKLLELIEE
jgi:CRP/FNR family transcriptional regulator